ncbi:restriction endonuclease subunit S [Pseudomonas luteola]|uniref:restriction endonuclease subunit S n=1 Tax=Pseudomonas luteola TaxID=47886 RepID=UPI000921464F|nr:restriction endonuclease subunit S [Pseudomonas zeshuii]SHJ40938.1 type I restriction enzyme, S subunit [Pseudomonas zeshuii]
MSRFKPYPAYKDSGVDWLGEVPERWALARGDAYLRSLAKIVSAADLNDKEVFHYSIPVVQATGNGQLEDGDEIDSSKLLIERSQILISKLNPRKNTVCLAWPRDVMTVCSGEFVPLQSDCMDLKWVYYLVSSENFRKRLESLVESATRSHQRVNPSDILKFRGAFPSFPEQTQIARFLDHETARIDALIEEQQRLIELLKEKRQAVISHAVTKGLDPTVPMKDSGVEWLGEVPAHWMVSKFGYISSVVRGGSPRPAGDPELFNGDFSPWVTVAEITKDDEIYLEDTETFLTKKGSDQCRIFSKGTLLLSNSGATLGVPKILMINANANDGVVGFENLSLDKEYSYFYLSTLTQGLRERAAGSGQPNLNTDIVKSIDVPIPPSSEVAEIVAAVRKLISQFHLLSKEATDGVRLLQERRSALISAAVTGKIDVRGWQPPASTQAPEPQAAEAV